MHLMYKFRSTLSDRNQNEILFLYYDCILLDSRSFSVEYFVSLSFAILLNMLLWCRGRRMPMTESALLRLADKNFFVPLGYSQWVVYCGEKCESASCLHSNFDDGMDFFAMNSGCDALWVTIISVVPFSRSFHIHESIGFTKNPMWI